MRVRTLLLIILGTVTSACVWCARAAERPPTVAVLANASDPDSLAVARHYLERRKLSPESLVALPMPTSEEISWEQFIKTIWNPLLRELVDRGWILASLSGDTDAIGRLRITSAGHKLDALVVCRGVPLRVAHDPTRFNPATHPSARLPHYASNEGAVDSELALLPVAEPPIAGLIPNPLFNESRPTTLMLDQIIPIGRLDGPTAENARGLVDRAVEAERFGLAGRAYVDIGGPHASGDQWLEECAKELTALGFETDVDRSRETFGPWVRFDAPVLYFGWYSANLNGPFLGRDIRFPPGAIALHIHSFSAVSLRSPTQGWAGPLIARGVTATLGNVSEPYLENTHQPHLLLRALARGEPLGRAALFSVRVLSWRAIVIGDPLYHPFAVSAEEQWERVSELPAHLETYARLRRIRLLAGAGRGDEAEALGRVGMRDNPTLPLALSLAGRQLAAGDRSSAIHTLGVFVLMPQFREADRPLALAAARLLASAGNETEALQLLDRLLAQPDLSREERAHWLGQSVEIARAAVQPVRAAKWEAERARLTKPGNNANAPAGDRR